MKMSTTSSRRARASLTALALAMCAVGGVGAAQQEAPPSGARLYLDCGACHGKDGGGVADGSVPAIGGQPARALVAALDDFRSSRRQDLRMRHFADPQHLVDAGEVAAVAAHVATLRRTAPAGTGDGRDLARGASLFRSRCASCHGLEGTASETPPRRALAGQHAGYIERKMIDGGLTAAQARRHAALAEEIGGPGVAAIADHLSRLPPP
jgi:cytochrome c553